MGYCERDQLCHAVIRHLHFEMEINVPSLALEMALLDHKIKIQCDCRGKGY